MEGYGGNGMYHLAFAFALFAFGFYLGYYIWAKIYFAASMKVAIISACLVGLLGGAVFIAGFYFRKPFFDIMI